jgi:CSLREA domain-containing protein
MSRPAIPRRFRPGFEPLEDRSVPAVITVTTVADDYTPNNGILSLREAIAAANANSAKYPPNLVSDDDVTANTTGAFGADTIRFAAGIVGTIPLDSFRGQLQITDPLSINGPGSGLLTLSGQNVTRVLGITAAAAPVAISGLTVADGDAGSGNGGGLEIDADTSLNDVVIQKCFAIEGGGIYLSSGVLTLGDVSIVANEASSEGGGIAVSVSAPPGTRITSPGTGNLVTFEGNSATLGGGISLAAAQLDGSGFIFGGNVAEVGGAVHTVRGIFGLTSSIFVNNKATALLSDLGKFGGAIFSLAGGGSIERTTFANNLAKDSGGAIYHSSDPAATTLAFANSTFVGNVAIFGGALELDASNTPGDQFVPVTLTHVTITQNDASTIGGGLRLVPTMGGGPAVSLLNSIVAGNTSPGAPDILGPIASAGNNLIGNTSGTTGFVASDIINIANPGLAPLSDYGGPTPTVALLPGSFALGNGNPAAGVAIDQRGLPRLGPIDIGAFQAQVPTANADSFSTPFDRPLDVPAAGVLANDQPNDPAYPVLRAFLATAPPAAQGTVVLNPDGSFTFTPATGFSGTASFTYFVTNGTPQGGVKPSLAATVTITVAAPVAPVANPDSFSIGTGQTLTVPAPGVLANDVVNNPNRTLSAVLDSPPLASDGTVALNPDGSFTFTAAPTFSGTATFTYRATDGVLTSAPATVTITGQAASHLFAVAAGAGGGPVVRVFNEDESLRFAFFAFDPRFGGGVRVAVGDVTGDRFDDIVVGAGPGGGPNVKVFDGVTGAEVASFFAYTPDFSLGVHLAVGDVNGDGFADIIAGAGSGGGPNVKVFSGRDRSELLSFFAYDPGFRGGARVGAGELDGFAGDEIVTIAGPSGGPDVRVWDRFGDVIDRFFAFDPAYRAGGFVSVLDGRILVAPDSFPDFEGSLLANQFTSLPGSRGGVGTALPSAALLTRQPEVRVFDFPVVGEDEAADPAQVFPVLDPGFLGGVRLAAGRHRDQPGVFVTSGPGSISRIQFFPYDGTQFSASPTLDDVALPDPGFLGSVYVGAGVE